MHGATALDYARHAGLRPQALDQLEKLCGGRARSGAAVPLALDTLHASTRFSFVDRGHAGHDPDPVEQEAKQVGRRSDGDAGHDLDPVQILGLSTAMSDGHVRAAPDPLAGPWTPPRSSV